MSVMMLAVEFGTEIQIRAEGEDADEAIQALKELFDANFDE
jgi:phosphotransferase system HPr (HPr) family protein